MEEQDSSLQGSERRRFKRARVSLTVVYRVNEPLSARMLTSDKEVQATVIDLSEGGMAVITNYPITSGTVLLIRFTLFRVDKDDVSFYGPVEITGEVRYNILLDKDQYRLGIEFVKIDEQDRREIVNFVNTAMNIHKPPQAT